MIAMAAVCLHRTVYFADTCYLGQDRDTVVNYAIDYAYCYLLCRLDMWPTVYIGLVVEAVVCICVKSFVSFLVLFLFYFFLYAL